MKAVLEIDSNDLNSHLIDVLSSLFQQNISEITLKKSSLKLEEFDKTLKLDEVLSKLKDNGHNELFLADLELGLKESSIYSNQ
ncbi:MAG: hypothetical protein ACOVNU_03285 [Candidatus Kapaibacteriota bacterium]|jgi:hypothetical protein